MSEQLMPPLNQAHLKKLFHYDPDTGLFTRLISRSGNAKAGMIAGSRFDPGGRPAYFRINIDGTVYLSHRLVWLYLYGRWPHPEIDHIDGDGTNNKLANLREATGAENGQNRGRQSNNKSGYIGVHKSKDGWVAQIGYQGKRHHLGLFKTPTAASEAYNSAKAKLHKFHPSTPERLTAARKGNQP